MHRHKKPDNSPKAAEARMEECAKVAEDHGLYFLANAIRKLRDQS